MKYTKEEILNLYYYGYEVWALNKLGEIENETNNRI